MTSLIAHDQLSRLPLYVWLIVFQFSFLIPRKLGRPDIDMLFISLARSTSTLVFQIFSFTSQEGEIADVWMQRQLQRLEFCTTSRISPSVKSYRIFPGTFLKRRYFGRIILREVLLRMLWLLSMHCYTLYRSGRDIAFTF